MSKKRLLVLLCVLSVLFSASASAVIIRGSLYDLSLDEVMEAVVEINTQPRQQVVAKNGTYSFNVPLGEYAIKARQYAGSEILATAEENITITKQGDFILDLILFPSFSEEEQILNDAEFDITAGIPEEEQNYVAVAALIIAVAAFFLLLRLRGREIIMKKQEIEKEGGSEKNKVLEFIKKEGGRTTQKEIRKNFPQSEAKISLIVAELESDGKLKKIKKGRGNIIILKQA